MVHVGSPTCKPSAAELSKAGREGLLGEEDLQQPEYPPRVAVPLGAMWRSLLFDPKPSHPTLAGIRKFGFAVPVS